MLGKADMAQRELGNYWLYEFENVLIRFFW
jgi:hypothetical protein